MNGAGQVAFIADLAGAGVTPGVDDRGLWSGAPDAPTLMAREGNTAADTGGAVFANLGGVIVLNMAGQVAFQSWLSGSGVTSGVNDRGIWVGRPGSVTLAARRGMVAPGAAGALFGTFSTLHLLNGAGHVAFLASLTGAGVTPGVNDQGIWVGTPGNLALVARKGDLAPGAAGAVFGGLSLSTLNGAGDVAFSAALTGSGVTSGVNDWGAWAGVPGNISLLARRGSSAPDTGGAVFGSSFSMALNGSGKLALKSTLTGSGVAPGVNDEGIWVGTPGDLALTVRRGDPAPGAGGAVFSDFATLVLNGAGEIGLRSSLAGNGVTPNVNDNGIWAGAPGQLALVARAGSPAPGAGGALFLSLGEVPVLNGSGELAFTARLAGSGVTPNVNDNGIWAGPAGDLQLIAREGNAIAVAPGDSRTVTDSSLFLNVGSGNEDGRRSGFSENGQTVFHAGFTGPSEGIFLSPPDLPTVHRMPRRAIGGEWNQVILPRTLADPVVVAGPPGSANKQPGVVRLRNIDGARGRFEARFQEWRYLDGVHPMERTDFLVLERGRHKQADGSVWEAGTIKLKGNRAWKKKKFAKRFRRPPQVFATVQSSRGGTAVAARVRNVTRDGFEVSIQEEEKDLGGRHPKETVGYLAIFSRTGRGTVDGGVNGTNYRLKQVKVKHRFKTVLGEQIRLEEEKSSDRERKHKKEAVSVMTLGRGLFAQQASDKEPDTTAIRRR